QPEVDYLGYIVGHNKIKIDPKCVAAIQSWPSPTNVTELRAFLGLTNTCIRFTPKFAHHTTALTQLLQGSPSKNAPITWTPEHQAEFENLKQTLSSPETLHILNPTKPVILHSDWLITAIRGWIRQDVDGKILPIAFESRKLRPAEKNYSPYDGELLALMHCI